MSISAKNWDDPLPLAAGVYCVIYDKLPACMQSAYALAILVQVKQG